MLRKRRISSLRSRLLISATIVLILFSVLTGVALESAFRESALRAQQDKLEGLIFALLTAAAPTETGALTISSDSIPDRRLQQATSGLQAGLFDENGKSVWRSTYYQDLPTPPELSVDQWQFSKLDEPDAFVMSYGVRWIDLKDDPQRYTITVLEDARSYHAQIRAYRRALSGWLAVSAVGLLSVELLLLRWGTAPLARLVSELEHIESGKQGEIRGEYPDELEPLTRGLNTMLRAERSQQVRYRNALGDLAHSLKTPLAVINVMGDDTSIPEGLRKPLQEQIAQIRQITDYQLRKAATAGRRTLAEPVPVRPIVDKITMALRKVYPDRNVQFEINVNASLRIRADAGDLFELIGNLLDNAAKYGGGHISVSVEQMRDYCTICIEDDGPGFPEDAKDLLLRGVRADMQTPGQGIGLAAALDIIKAYDGELDFGRSEKLGGGQLTLTLMS